VPFTGLITIGVLRAACNYLGRAGWRTEYYRFWSPSLLWSPRSVICPGGTGLYQSHARSSRQV